MTEPLRRTKIICTLGPSTDQPGVLSRFVEAGLDIARINTAHGSVEEHVRRIQQLRAAARAVHKPIGILIDLPGPKFRLGTIPGGWMALRPGSEVTLRTGPAADASTIPVRYPRLHREVRPGETLYLADGTVKLVVIQVKGRNIRCRVAIGGRVRSGSGVNLPESDLAVKLPTLADAKWIAFAKAQRAEWVGVSFVRMVEDIARVRRRIGRAKDRPMLMAKIEKRQALDQLDGIVEAADGVMVARGDLGVETPLEEVPIVQKRIIARANASGKPVVTATQMLESMIEHPSPTRAEVTDVANAVLDGSDALMLSGETAVGRYPVEAVRMLHAVIRATEAHYPFDLLMRDARAGGVSAADALSSVACRLSDDVNAKAIIVPLEQAAIAFQMARYRPRAPILALAESSQLGQQLAVGWDIYPLIIDDNSKAVVPRARQWLFRRKLARKGDHAVVVFASSKVSDQIRDALQVVRL